MYYLLHSFLIAMVPRFYEIRNRSTDDVEQLEEEEDKEDEDEVEVYYYVCTFAVV